MAFTKIGTSDLSGKGVIGLPDTPQLTTEEMQQKFDELALSVLVPAFNRLVDELGAHDAASNIGISLPEGIALDSNVAAVINWMLSDISESDQLRHSHANKAVLDLISLAVKSEYDRLVTLLDGIYEISATVKNSADSIPTGKAISEYISELGGGDMLKAVYDTDNSGVVDNSEKLGGQLPSFYQKATDGTLQTEDKTIPGAINEVREMAENGGKNLIGDEFSSTKSYSVGDYAIKDNILYRFTEDKEAGEWDETKVESTTVDNELSGLNANMEYIDVSDLFTPGPNCSIMTKQAYRIGKQITYFLKVNCTTSIRYGTIVSIDNSILPKINANAICVYQKNGYNVLAQCGVSKNNGFYVNLESGATEYTLYGTYFIE